MPWWQRVTLSEPLRLSEPLFPWLLDGTDDIHPRAMLGGNEAGPEPSRVGTQDNLACASLPTSEDLLLLVPSSWSSLAPVGHHHLHQKSFLQQNPTLRPSPRLVVVCMWALQP